MKLIYDLITEYAYASIENNFKPQIMFITKFLIRDSHLIINHRFKRVSALKVVHFMILVITLILNA